MRLFTKIFLFGMLVFGAAFSVSGYFLLHYSLEGSVAREVDFALKQYQYDKFTVQSALLTYGNVSLVVSFGDELGWGTEKTVTWWKAGEEGEISPVGQRWRWKGGSAGTGEGFPGDGSEEGGEGFSGDGSAGSSEESAQAQEFWNEVEGKLFAGLGAEISVPVAFYAQDKTPLYSEIDGLDAAFLDSLSQDAHVYQFREGPEGGSVLVGSMLAWEGLPGAAQGQSAGEEEQKQKQGEPGPIYFVTQWDISKTLARQDTMQRYFLRCYLIAMGAGMVLLGILSALLTGPLKRMSRAARRMAEGDYGQRLALSGRDEIGELGESFNQMADAVEEKVAQLEKAAREKEDFVSNFAHELKTPLTSIIGYADTIYQKDLGREEVRKASWQIWNEGMRLESLSLKLMELTVLGRQEFPLLEMPGDELLQDMAESLLPVLREKEIDFRLEAEPAYVRVDCDLLKTLLINLVDNSIKAGSGRICLTGRVVEGKYRVSVRDDGCGMEEEELSRITEAFYMVDKSRSRKQHGAGLGLALAERIAGIHGSKLHFASRKGEGTEVSFSLDCEKAEEVAEDSAAGEPGGGMSDSVSADVKENMTDSASEDMEISVAEGMGKRHGER